tara:strand:+ start:248 stop:796 length:549 start_codon:yes stop_codon:yes gene_type:complete
MSQIGKKIINVPSDISIDLQDNLLIASKGNHKLSCVLYPEIKVTFEDLVIKIDRVNNEKKSRELHGLVRSLVNNIIIGLTDGFSKELNLIGVGYTVESKGDFLLLNLGFSHPIYFQKPEGIDFDVPNNTTIIVKGVDNQLVGDVSAKIRELRKPEPYKGKGVRYKDEYVRKKAGKTVGGASA